MRCPHCSQDNENNAIFCSACSAWILNSMYDDQTMPDLPEESDQDSAKLKRKLRWFSILASGLILAGLGVLALIWFLPEKQTPAPFIHQQHSYYTYSPYQEVYLFYDGKLVDNSSFIARNSYQSTISLDGRTAAYLTADREMLLVCDGEVVLRETDILQYALAASGSGAAYISAQDNTLYHFDCETNTTTMIERILPDDPGNNFTSTLSSTLITISPDGKSVAYFSINLDGSSTLKLFSNGGSSNICRNLKNFYLIGLSDHGQQIYLHNDIVVHCFDASGNLAALSSIAALDSGPLYHIFHLNADHSQLLFYHGGTTYLSENSQEATLLFENQVFPVLPAQTARIWSADAFTYPIQDLQGQLYYENILDDGNILSSTLYDGVKIWQINGESRVLLDTAKQYWLDPSGTILYYTTKNTDLMRLDLSARRKEPIKLAAKVNSFIVSYDCSRVYYTSGRELTCCDGKNGSKAEQVTQAYSGSLVMSKDNIPYYCSMTTVYAIGEDEDGISSHSVIEMQSGFSAQGDGTVYFVSSDGLYISTEDGNLKQIASIHP